MKTHRGEKTSCPYCHHNIDAHSTTDADDRPPKDGDYAMCAYCNGVSLFDAHGKLRRPRTPDEGSGAMRAAASLGWAIHNVLRSDH